jgi:DNA-binding transcriptional LysR family regulator
MMKSLQDGLAGHADGPRIDLGIPDSRRLQMLYITIREGTFASAAQVLKVSPSAISHAVKTLEEEFDCSLFKRNGPNVNPTGTALRLMPLIEEVLNTMASIKGELATMEGRREMLSFAISPCLRELLKPSVLSSFRECFPRAGVEILQVNHSESPTERNFDFEIGYLESMPIDSVYRHLLHEELNLYAAPFHNLGTTSKVSSEDLRNNTLVFPNQQSYEMAVARVFHGMETGLKSWILPDATTARDFARNGQCLALLPAWLVKEDLAAGSLRMLKAPGMGMKRSCCAWWKSSRPLPWIAEVFLSLMASEVADDARPPPD